MTFDLEKFSGILYPNLKNCLAFLTSSIMTEDGVSYIVFKVLYHTPRQDFCKTFVTFFCLWVQKQ